MKRRTCYTMLCFLEAFVINPIGAEAQRQMENLGRGLIAVRDGNGVYLGWRMFGTDPANVGFDVYRSSNGGQAVRVNSSPISNSTNFVDTSVNLSQQNSYFIAPSIGNTPLKHSSAVALPGNPPGNVEQAHFRIPLQPLANHYVHFAWVGDLDGDGEYDYVVDRLPETGGVTQKLEAYSSNGDFLWRVDMGPGSLDQDNIEGGPSTISIGHHDGVTVYDMDGDGHSEVLIKSANGVTFGDGQTLQAIGRNRQFVSVLDGRTGAELARADVPGDYVSDGPVTGHFGIGYLDGQRPSLLYSAQNRVGNGPFNRMVLAYDYREGEMSQRWKWKPLPGDDIDKFHQIRVGDVDRDGKDELLDGGFVIDDNGSLLYSIPDIVHGDRFHVGDLDPDRPGLEGYGIQQDHPGGLVEYYYDAATGEVLREHRINGVVDNGRGVAADVDPNHEGYEYWSFFGMHNAQTGQLLAQEPNRPWPNFRIWWDGDVGSENLNETKVEKWNPSSQTVSRLLTGYREGATETWRGAPLFYGDILGDWREEIIFEHFDHSSLIIFTTTDPTDTRLYTLAHNPLYRNDMTTRGYYQSNMVDYFLGFGMDEPPMPDIFVLPLVPGDADGDGLVTELDLTAVGDHLGNMGPAGGSLLGDADGNGVVDSMDYYTVNNILEPQIAAGDYNQDGVVDAADYIVWRSSLDSTGSELAADGNFDNVVDAQDYNIWITNFGRIVPATGNKLVSAVPEPATGYLLAALVSSVISACRPSRRR